MPGLRMKCAECDCVVERALRVVVCTLPHCCCREVPVAPWAVEA